MNIVFFIKMFVYIIVIGFFFLLIIFIGFKFFDYEIISFDEIIFVILVKGKCFRKCLFRK